MATFQVQVEGLTQLSVGTTPTTGELTQFLVDGVKEVTNRIIQIRPESAHLFATTATLDGSPETVNVDSGVVLNVWRENGTASQLEGATEIDADMRYRASDSTSLAFRSKYNPAWFWAGNIVNIVPTPGSSGDEATVKYVAYDTTVAVDSSTVTNFPDQYEYLVALYASFKSLQAALAMKDLPTDIVFLDIPNAPDAPTLNPISFTFSETLADAAISYTIATQSLATTSSVDAFATAPTYTAPTTDLSALEAFSEFSDTLVNLSISSVSPDAPNSPEFTTPTPSLQDAVGTFTKTLSGTPPEYDSPTIDLSAIEIFSAFSGALADLSVSATAPVAISAPAIASPGIATIAKGDISGDVPNYNSGSIVAFDGLFSSLAAKTVTDLSITAVSPDLPILSITSVTLTGSAPTYTPPGSIGLTTFLGFSGTLGNLDISATAPSAVGAPSITSDGISTIDKADVTTNVPTYSKPATSVVTVIPDAPSLATINFNESNSLNITAIAPITISLTDIEYIDADNTDATNSNADSTNADITSIVPVTVGNVEIPDISNNIPDYTKLVTSSAIQMNAFANYWTLSDFGDSDPGILSITAVSPDVPSLDIITFSESNALSISASNPTAISLTNISYEGISDTDASVDDAFETTINLTEATQPTYNSGDIIGMEVTTHVLESKSIINISINAVIPDTPNSPDFSVTEITEGTAVAGSLATMGVVTSIPIISPLL